jgi:hypothetical protein
MFVSIKTFFLIARFLFVFFFLKDAPVFGEDNTEQLRQVSPDRYPVIELTKELQQITGLQTMEAQSASYRPEFMAFGKAISLQPLLALRHQYLQALTEGASAKAKFIQSEAGVKRVRDLLTHGVAAKRRLQEQQSQWRVDKSQVDANYYKMQAIADEARLSWGKQLTEWALTADSDELDSFLAGQDILLQITMPSNRKLADDIRTIYVDATGNRGKAHEASLISSAPQTDISMQGMSYFFQTPVKEISPGMAVSAWISEDKNAVEGVVIPKSAVLWLMNQQFVYIKSGEMRFSRRLITKAASMNDGYFIEDAIRPGEHVVTKGGQLLLSEELRGQISNEEDD